MLPCLVFIDNNKKKKTYFRCNSILMKFYTITFYTSTSTHYTREKIKWKTSNEEHMNNNKEIRLKAENQKIKICDAFCMLFSTRQRKLCITK